MLKYEWWEYFLIPWIAGFVGYITNVVALHIMFYPIEYWGIEIFRLKGEPWGIIGYQGVIPTKAEKMANITFDLMTTKLLDIQEIFMRIDPKKFSQVMNDAVLLMMDSIINEIAMEYLPIVWMKLPQKVKDDIIVMANRESIDNFMIEFMKDMQRNIQKVVDLKHLSVSAAIANKRLVNQVFLEAGDKELQLIRRSGLYFGFLFGIIQMCIWFVYDARWILPVAGFLVGWVTNWLALKIIFRPLNPRTFCYCLGPIQGLFLKRQIEVSETFARVICVEFVHVKAIWDAVFTGRLKHNFYAMLRAHTLTFTEKFIEEVKPLIVVLLGSATLSELKERIASKVMEKMPAIIDRSYEYTNDALDMETTMRTKMQKLSPEEFEGVLHPAFQEDEILLIIAGGILGAIVGTIELFVLFEI